MTKAAQIRKLIALGRSNLRIAERVGCHTAYVRSVRQRDNGINGRRPCDQRYLDLIKTHGDLEKARKAGRTASAAGRSYSAAYARVMRQTALKSMHA